MAMLAMGLSLVGSIFGAMGAMQQANAAAASMQYQAQVAQMNKQIAEQNARYAVLAGETQAQRTGLKARAELGAITAAEGASGLDIATGSPKAVAESSFRLGTYNEALVRSDAQFKAHDYLTQAFQYDAQSRLYEFGAQNERRAGMLGAASSLLGGLGSVAGRWYQYGGGQSLG